MTDDAARARFPQGGADWDDLQTRMAGFAEGDVDWRRGRSPLFVFKNDEETYEIGRRAFFEFFNENGLGGARAFFGIGRMESDVLDYGLSLFQAPDAGAGVFTPGGSESIFLAVKAARDAFRARPGAPRTDLNIVMPDTAHAAFDKAAQVMDLEIRRAPLGPDRRVDAAAMAGMIDARTMLLVGSAPCYPHGVVDPIAEISAIAAAHDVWLHVDACVGGWLLPFFAANGRDVPVFDFRLAGVRSISADLHKFGFCPKPASTVFYRDVEDRDRARFVADAWPSGVFRTSTLAGTRPGGAVAAAWAVLNHLGVSGYRKAADRLARMTDAYVADIEAIEGLELWARPDFSILNFGSRTLDMQAVSAGLAERGWLTTLTRRPVGLHLMMSLLHEGAREDYVADLKAAVAAARLGEAPAADPGGMTYAG
ncbi:aminotransferase class V-fold PLP-dependent enzyme [Albimonas sp. CAU 1670]|uniref:pyridoxal phosphate-dependent decarboxylase family protein n=1 Tax=Albimonas sp. CAU 1670 TaxID=3032599 RepID=UPI0023DB4E9C|nr:aminotransferase class V-fold PLP-dependent enzyme [Albimonas sp. CAU 1670]MDF2234829.1 aminotransferase class V-fold PLP-dependent enzyme [Albimonas sp. CAU 1670]